jgi:hypothetical protein
VIGALREVRPKELVRAVHHVKAHDLLANASRAGGRTGEPDGWIY